MYDLVRRFHCAFVSFLYRIWNSDTLLLRPRRFDCTSTALLPFLLRFVSFWPKFQIVAESPASGMGGGGLRKRAKVRNRYNQAPHLTQDTNGNIGFHKCITCHKAILITFARAIVHHRSLKCNSSIFIQQVWGKLNTWCWFTDNSTYRLTLWITPRMNIEDILW